MHTEPRGRGPCLCHGSLRTFLEATEHFLSLMRSPQRPVEQLVVLILQLRRPRFRKSKGTASWQSGQAKNSGLLTTSPGLQKRYLLLLLCL